LAEPAGLCRRAFLCLVGRPSPVIAGPYAINVLGAGDFLAAMRAGVVRKDVDTQGDPRLGIRGKVLELSCRWPREFDGVEHPGLQPELALQFGPGDSAVLACVSDGIFGLPGVEDVLQLAFKVCELRQETKQFRGWCALRLHLG